MDDNLNQYEGGSGGPGNGSGGPGGPGGSGGSGSSGNDPRKQSLIMLAVAAIVTLLCISLFMKMMTGATNQEISYNAFIDMIAKDKIESVTVESDRVVIYPKEAENKSPFAYGYGLGTMTYYTGKMEDDDTLTKRLLEKNIEIKKPTSDSSSIIMTVLLYYVLPILLMWGLMSLLFRRMGGKGGPMGVGKSTAKAYVQKETGITFKDVAGEDEAKESLVEVVDFLHNPGKYSKIGARLPKGALLVGPPGTGKTLLAKAVAGEAHVPFFSLSGSDFIELYVGVGASRVRDLFKEAEKNAPCIVFIDEIDAIGRSRDSKYGGGNEEREQTLNQLLVEMDGFGTNSGVIIMAATNRPDVLDPALLRPGRFDRQITVNKPDMQGREDILRVHARNKPLAPDVDLKDVAKNTTGFTGADLENLLNEAALLTARRGKHALSYADIQDASTKVMMGAEKKSHKYSEKAKKLTAYHEAGHAILFHVLPDVGPVYTVSVIPTGQGAGGYTMPLPEKDEMYLTKGKMLQDIIVCLGGRIAESLVFEDVTTGASQDIRQATERARDMVMKYGFSDELGMINYSTSGDEVFIGRDIGHSKNFSEGTAEVIDREVKKIIDDCHEHAMRLLKENLEVLHRLAALLIEKERIAQSEFLTLFEQNDDTLNENE